MKKKPLRKCLRCDRSIRPEHDSHATLTTKIRDCNGAGQWIEDAYKPVYLCETCWRVVDAAFAPPSASEVLTS